jgi:hypothetical protein
MMNEFTFPLPLRWPASEPEKSAYAAALVDYVRTMEPILNALSHDDRREIQATLVSFAVDLRRLWSGTEMPSEVRAFLRHFE